MSHYYTSLWHSFISSPLPKELGNFNHYKKRADVLCHKVSRHAPFFMSLIFFLHRSTFGKYSSHYFLLDRIFTFSYLRYFSLQRHPKMDLSKSDLLKLLSYLEGELQARDVVIATLKVNSLSLMLELSGNFQLC